MNDNIDSADGEAEREVVIVSWGKHPGKVIGVLRRHTGVSVVDIHAFMKQECPVVAVGGPRNLDGLLWELQDAGAQVQLRWK